MSQEEKALTKEEIAEALKACRGDRQCELEVMERVSRATSVGAECGRCGCRPGEADLWALKYRAALSALDGEGRGPGAAGEDEVEVVAKALDDLAHRDPIATASEEAEYILAALRDASAPTGPQDAG